MAWTALSPIEAKNKKRVAAQSAPPPTLFLLTNNRERSLSIVCYLDSVKSASMTLSSPLAESLVLSWGAAPSGDSPPPC